MAQLIDGKRISQEIKDELKVEVQKLKEQGKEICLAVVQVGSDPASTVYVRNKKKACAYIGIESRAYELPEETTEDELVRLIEELNQDESSRKLSATGSLSSSRFRSTSTRIRSSGPFHLTRT